MGKQITNFKQLIEDNNALLRSIQGKGTYVPPLQSDYTIAIVPNYKAQPNSSFYHSVLVTSIDLNMLSNGLNKTKDKFGFLTSDFSFTQHFKFSYIGIPFLNPYTEKVFTSLIHYYYSTQFSDKGTFRVKTKNWILPAIYVINQKTENVVYTLYDCTFSYPTFSVSPQSNDLIVYNTNVFFNSYKEFLYDDYKHLGKVNDRESVMIGGLENT